MPLNTQAAEIASPTTKAAIAWGTAGVSNGLPAVFAHFGITSWAEAAQFAGFVSGAFASILTFCYLAEWWWKRAWRPLFVWLGLAQPTHEQADE